ncbi:serine hydrolase domain-containing protein [Sinomonas gamaensis]|uniref:serine hydrolase domain-containing protein n=1 Tax=Sinomonas gamaensis TaxID=2565624 RepID=UPI0011097360|nr:serine hydrolase [Sinomonas gamaensis]
MPARTRSAFCTAAAALVLALTACTSPAAAPLPSPLPSPSDSPTGYLDAVLQSLVDQGAVSAVVQVRWPGVEWSKAYGVRDLDTKVPAQPRDRIQVADLTEVLVAPAVLHLIEEGRIELGTPVNGLIPGFEQTLHPPGPVTVWQLLTHESGIPEFQDALFQGTDLNSALTQHITLQHALELAGTLQWHPSDVGKNHYSSTDYMVLALLLQTLRGKPFADVLRDEVIGRLGLQHTSTGLLNVNDPDLRHGYITIHGQRRDDTENTNTVDTPLGGISTVADLNAFYAALLQGKAVSPASLKEMKKPSGSAPFGMLNIWPDKCSGGSRYGGVGGIFWEWLTVSISSDDGQYQASVSVVAPPLPTHLEDPATDAKRLGMIAKIQGAVNAALDRLCHWRG